MQIDLLLLLVSWLLLVGTAVNYGHVVFGHLRTACLWTS